MVREKKKITPLGRQIKKKLIDKNMTQRELAEILGIHYKYLNRIIYGERAGKKYIYMIAEALGIKIEKYL